MAPRSKLCVGSSAPREKEKKTKTCFCLLCHLRWASPLQNSPTWVCLKFSRHRSRMKSSSGKCKQELFPIMWPNCHFLSIEKTILTGQGRKTGTPGKLVHLIPCCWGCVLTLTSFLNAKAPWERIQPHSHLVAVTVVKAAIWGRRVSMGQGTPLWGDSTEGDRDRRGSLRKAVLLESDGE